MDRQDVVRDDFPEADRGFERASVVAHLEAVAAQLEALEARARALEVELEAVRAAGASVGPDHTERGPASVESRPASPAEVAPTEEELVAARLVATEMVLGGADRENVVERIQAEYGLGNAGALVDEVIEKTG